MSHSLIPRVCCVSASQQEGPTARQAQATQRHTKPKMNSRKEEKTPEKMAWSHPWSVTPSTIFSKDLKHTPQNMETSEQCF